MHQLQYIDILLFEQQVGTLAVFDRAASVFVQALPKWKARLLDAVKEKDSDLISDLIHQMKGTSAMMCATPLRDYLIEMECKFLNGNLDDMNGALARLSFLLAETEAELRLLGTESKISLAMG